MMRTSIAGLGALFCCLVFAACSETESTPSASPDADADADADATASDAGTNADGEADASTQNDADASDPDAGSSPCLSGGTSATATGTGTCADPYVIDISGSALGTVFSHVATGGSDVANLSGGPSACTTIFTGTARDVIYEVVMPAGVSSLTVSVDAATGVDARIGVHEDPSCAQPINSCANETGVGTCEFVVAPKGGAGFFGTTTFVTVSELVDSGQSMTVRVRAD